MLTRRGSVKQKINLAGLTLVYKKNFLKQRELRYKKAFVMHAKMLRIVCLRCRSSVLVVCESEIWLENLQTLTMRARLFL